MEEPCHKDSIRAFVSELFPGSQKNLSLSKLFFILLLILVSVGNLFSQVLNLGHTAKIENGFGSNPPLLRSPYGVFVRGNFAYVTSGTGNALEIIDITLPALPSAVGSIKDGDGGALLNQPLAVYVSGNYAYVTSQSVNGSLEIIDISNPTAPVHVGSLTSGTGGASFKTAYGLQVVGNYVYIAGGSGNSLEIVDATNKAAPVHLGSLLDGGGSAPYLQFPQGVVVSGNYAYLACANALEIVDVTNPAAPVHKGSLLDGAGVAPFLTTGSGITLSGNYAYIASFGNGSLGTGALEVVDITNPAAPVHAASLVDGAGVAPFLSGANSVTVSGNYAYVASNASNAFEIVDVTNPLLPLHKGSLVDGAGGATLKGPVTVAISGNTAYVSSNGSNALEIIDVSNPTIPTHKTNLVTGSGGAQIGSSRWVHISGNYAYIVSQDIGSLEIVDISFPSVPVHKGSILDGGGSSPYLANAYGVYVQGHYAYVVGFNSNTLAGTLEIIDVANPAAPIHVGSLLDGAGGANLFSARAVVVVGSYAFVLGRTALEIVNVINPAAPSHTGKISGGFIANGRSLKVSGNLVYAVGTGGLTIIDVTTPATPIIKATLADGGDPLGDGSGVAPFLLNPRAIYLSGNYAYVTSLSRNALEIVDISNPLLPVHKGSIKDGVGGALLAGPEVVSVSGNYAFVTTATSYVLEVIDVSNPAAPVHYSSLANGTDGALLQEPDGLAIAGNYAYVTGLGGGLEIVYFYSPAITSISPNTGAPGTTVTITGQNMKESMTVAFNGVPVIAHGLITPTSAVVTVPDGATIGPLSVTVDGQKIKSTTNFIVIPSASNATNIGQTSFTANWSDVGAKGYFLDVSTDNFATFVSGYNSLSLGKVTSLSIAGLSPATAYQYRVRSSDGSTSSDNSNTISLLTIPATPVANAATSVGQTNFNANWTAVTGATGYYLDAALDIGFTKFLVGFNNLSISGSANNSQFVSGLTAYTTYYYRVRSADANGVSASSNVITVSTLDIIPPAISNSAFPNPLTISAGVQPVLNTTIVDNVSVDSAKIFFRGISEKNFKSADMQGAIGTTGGNFSVTVQTDWYDQMGLEYYFLAKDEAGNKSVTASSYMQLITPSITLPALPSGTNQTDYRIVAFPYQLQAPLDNKVTTVYQNVPWNDNTKAAMFWWNPTLKNNTGSYDQYASGAITNIEPGKGYWVLVSTPTTPQLTNVNAPKYNHSNLYSMTLKPKWNEIGNPYPVPISWDDVIALNQEINPGALFSPLNIYDGNGYKPVTSGTPLRAFEGGFVKNLGTSDISILIPFPGQTAIGGRVAAIGSDISQDSWNVFLHIDQNGHTNQLGGFGMHPLAQSGPDRFDNFNPPRFLNIPEVNFINSESPGSIFSNNMVKSQGDYTWQFTPAGSIGAPAELNWSPDINTNSRQLYLLDEEQIKVIDMGIVSHYDFTLTSKSSFRIFYGSNIQDKVTTQSIAASAPYPNPLTRDAAAKINVALPDSNDQYQVTMQLYNGQGDLIETLNRSLASGLHQLEFTLSGQSLSPGIYIYKLAVASDKTSSVYSGKIIKP